MEVLGRTVSSVAHDFNNLITGVLLYADLLSKDLPPESRLHRHVIGIRKAGEQGAALIRDLLAVARQQVTEPILLTWMQVISEIRDLLCRLLGEHIELEVISNEKVGQLKMPLLHMQQILLNVALNARDAMPEGGKITIEIRNSCATVRERVPQIEISFTDTGCGMNEETRAHLFRPFFTTKASGRGNGLGLFTVHSIVAQNNGTVQVASSPGRGTCVTVRLPQAVEDQLPKNIAGNKRMKRSLL